MASVKHPASWRDPAARKRTDAHANKILTMLTEAGSRGCTNSQLWTVCHAVNSRISNLRRRGHHIVAESEGSGIWRYRLIPPEPQQHAHGPEKSPCSLNFEQRRRREEAEALPLFAGGTA